MEIDWKTLVLIAAVADMIIRSAMRRIPITLPRVISLLNWLSWALRIWIAFLVVSSAVRFARAKASVPTQDLTK